MQGRRGDSSRGLPAIAPRDDGSKGPQGTSTGQSFGTGSRRNRLPPRSRLGCWTCRDRKVKCDEQRPACGQCARLGHTCDYNPRLAFRDDTPRVVEKMQEVSTAGSSVWNSEPSSPSPSRAIDDLLPPFAALTTDEDRERKAELQDPGTYHVIANPRSFESLPQYRDDSAAVLGAIRTAFGADGESSSIEEMEDPNVVILRTFDEPQRRTQTLSPNRSNSSRSPSISQVSASHSPLSMVQANTPGRGRASPSMLDMARSGGKDAALLQRFRTTISPLLVQVDASDNDEDLFETQARFYPPLYHAMMALAALSNANRNGDRVADALEHYQSVIPALQTTVQSSRDSYSDGALFTHFLLLLYEIAAAGDRESNMWQHHIDQLLRIITLRQQAFGSEKYGFIVWTICSIDIYALLTVSGKGAVAEALIKRNILPTPEDCLPSASSGPYPIIYPEEQSFFPSILKFNQEVTLLGLQIGQLAQSLRQEAIERQYEGRHRQTISDEMFLLDRTARVQNLHRLIQHSRNAWRAQHVDYLTLLSEPRPPRVFSQIIHSCTFFRACLIYSYTCLYPNQLLDMDQGTQEEVQVCASEIIGAGRLVILEERFDLQSIVFSLSVAGTATKNPEEKALALDIIRKLEHHSHSRTIRSGRILVETMYEKQRAILESGQAATLDWVEEIESSGQRLIFYGI